MSELGLSHRSRVGLSNAGSAVPSALGDSFAAPPPSTGSAAGPPVEDRIVELNVGGTPYTTMLSTLLTHPTSQLAQTFQEPFALSQDPSGRYFMDRNGPLFAHVLDYLREGQVQGVSPDDIPKVTQLAGEFAYFGLPHILPFEELFKRQDWTTYSMSDARRGGGNASNASNGPSKYSHVRVKVLVQSPSSVVQVDLPRGSKVPRPTTSFLDDVLEHYGSMGYKVVAVTSEGSISVQYTLARDSSGDIDGALPSANGTRPGSHPASSQQNELPPQVMDILNRVRDINASVGPQR